MNGYTILTEVYVYNPAEEQVAGPFDTEEQAEEWCRNAEPWGAGRDPYGRPDPQTHPIACIPQGLVGDQVCRLRAESEDPHAATAPKQVPVGRGMRCSACGCVSVTTNSGRWICGGMCPN